MQLAHGELIPELKNALCEAGLEPRVLVLALQSSPDEIPQWSAEYQGGLLDGDLAHLLQEVQAAFAHFALRTQEEPVGFLRAYYLLELWVYRGGMRAVDLGVSPDFKAEFENLRNYLRVTHEVLIMRYGPVMGPYLRMSSAYNAARALVSNLGLKNWQESNA